MKRLAVAPSCALTLVINSQVGQRADQREEDEERDFTSQGAADESGHVECAGDGAKHEIVHVEDRNESVGRERCIHGV